jgi:hypothetical protein
MKPLSYSGVLPHGISIEGVIYKHFDLREAFLADMIEAEVDSGGAANGIHYNAQLAVRQLTRVHDGAGNEFAGPFVISMIKKRGDFLALRQGQLKLDELGNDELGASGNTGAPSS